VRTDSNYKIVFAVPMDGLRDIEDRGREAGEVFANLHSVQPNARAKLSLVDSQNRDRTPGSDFKCAVVPEPVAALSRHPRVLNKGAPRQFALCDTVLNNLPAIELVDIGEGR
jgi:hypothetical protein